VEAVKNNDNLKRRDLARLCGGVAEETVSDYIRTLKKLGYPIIYNYETGGYEFYREDYTDLDNSFTLEEVIFLLLALDSVQSIDREDIHNLKRKLLSLLPEEMRQEVKEVIERLSVGNSVGEGKLISLGKIQQAILDEKKINLIYESAVANNPSTKQVIPYAVTWQRDKCYLIGSEEGSEEIINYRLDRIKDLNLTEEKGKLPEDFNLEDYLAETWRMFSGEPQEVVLKFSREIETLVTDNFAADYYEIIEETKGSFTIQTTVRGLEGLKIWLLSLGTQVKVIKPESLKKELLKTAQGLVEQYQI